MRPCIAAQTRCSAVCEMHHTCLYYVQIAERNNTNKETIKLEIKRIQDEKVRPIVTTNLTFYTKQLHLWFREYINAL